MSACEVIGLRIRCPNLNRIVSASREHGDYAIGPLRSPIRFYRIRCRCGKLHIVPTRSVSKPTKARPARPLKNGKKSG